MWSTPVPGGAASDSFIDFSGPWGDGGHFAVEGLISAGYRGVYTNLGGSLQKVVSSADPLEGKLISSFQVAFDFISGNGIVFVAGFVDSSQGIFLATPNPASLIEDLVDQVVALNLQNGISNSLDAKLDAALKALDDLNENNDSAAINTLNAFINAVNAQSASFIDTEDAAALVLAAQEIIDILTEGQ